MSQEFDWEQAFCAVRSLSPDSNLIASEPRKWIFRTGLEIGGNGLLEGLSGHGRTPADAVIEVWDRVLRLPADRYIVVHPLDEARRRHYRWAGFMWQEQTVLEVG